MGVCPAAPPNTIARQGQTGHMAGIGSGLEALLEEAGEGAPKQVRAFVSRGPGDRKEPGDGVARGQGEPWNSGGEGRAGCRAAVFPCSLHFAVDCPWCQLQQGANLPWDTDIPRHAKRPCARLGPQTRLNPEMLATQQRRAKGAGQGVGALGLWLQSQSRLLPKAGPVVSGPTFSPPC